MSIRLRATLRGFAVRSKALLAIGIAALAGASGTAGAETTTVNAQGHFGNERCLTGGGGGNCSGGTYHGAFSLVKVFENDLGAGASLVRVDDEFDKIWINATDSGGQVQGLARYAGDKSKLGFDATVASGGYTTLRGILLKNKVRVNNASAYAGDTKPGDFIVQPDSWTTIPVLAGTPFAFVLKDKSMGYKITSNPDSGVGAIGYANSGLALDYMVTFQVWLNGVAQQHYFIAWEDRNPLLGNTGDYDYNDYVAEVRFANPVPEPETYAMLLAGLGLMALAARRRRLKYSAA